MPAADGDGADGALRGGADGGGSASPGTHGGQRDGRGRHAATNAGLLSFRRGAASPRPGGGYGVALDEAGRRAPAPPSPPPPRRPMACGWLLEGDAFGHVPLLSPRAVECTARARGRVGLVTR